MIVTDTLVALPEEPPMGMTIRKIPLPFPRRVSPLSERVERHNREWARKFGLLGTDEAARRFDSSDYGGFAARAYPMAEYDDLTLCVEWMSWYALIDDQLSEGEYATPQAWHRVMPDLSSAILSSNRRFSTAGSLAVRALADMCRRTFSRMSPGWRARFSAHLLGTLHGLADEAASDGGPGDILTVDAYLGLRRVTAGVPFYVDLIELAERAEVPEAVYQAPEFLELVTATTDLVCLHNDIYSAGKERARGNNLNLALILERVHGIGPDQAILAVAARAEQRAEQFRVARQKLVEILPKTSAASLGGQGILRCVLGMQDWVNANLEWCQYSPRYSHIELTADGNRPSYMEDLLRRPAVA
jgi:Terpene synthase family 2, C-terminal metal binding